MIDDGKGGIWRKDVYDLIEAIANATPADDGALRKRIQDVLADAPQTRDWWFHYELSNRLAGDDPDTIRASLRDAGNEMSIQAREILPQVLAGIALAGKPILRGSVRQQGDTQPVPTASALTRPGSANGKSSQGLDTSPAAIPIIPANTRGKSNLTKGGLARTASKDWREYRGVFDATGYGGALSAKNRELIAKGRVPIVDEAWVEYHPEDAGLIGEEIQIHHVDGLLPRVPLPYTRHMDAHRPGGPRWNRGGPGSAAPFYPRKRRDE
jgi:hypothetical protein